jgi:hypothetical protein
MRYHCRSVADAQRYVELIYRSMKSYSRALVLNQRREDMQDQGLIRTILVLDQEDEECDDDESTKWRPAPGGVLECHVETAGDPMTLQVRPIGGRWQPWHDGGPVGEPVDELDEAKGIANAASYNLSRQAKRATGMTFEQL